MKHKRIEIGTGDAAIAVTVENMLRLARRDSKNQTIIDIARRLKRKSKNENELVNNIFDFVKDNVKYRYDNKGAEALLDLEKDLADRTELLIAPIHLLGKVKQGDCDDMAMLYAAICLACGLPVNFKIIAWRIDSFTHVYCEVGMTETFKKPYWIPADCVLGTFGKEQSGIKRYKTFRV